MKKIIYCILITMMIVSTVVAQTQEQERIILFNTENNNSPFIINPNSFFEKELTLEKKDYPIRRVLRIAGGSILPNKFALRGETNFRKQEFLIDDNLDSLIRSKDKYSLYFKGENYQYEQHAYNRITSLELSKGTLDLDFRYKTKHLKVEERGDFGIELQLYYKKEGRNKDDIYDKPDSIVFIAIPQGTKDFTQLKKSVKIPINTVTILMRIGGTNFSGECWLESPRLVIEHNEIFNSPFTPHRERSNDYNYWVGVNMATRSWPRWEVEFNGQTLFEGNIFDRASDIADFYIPLPKHLSGKGNLKLILKQEGNRKAYSYMLKSLEIIEESAEDFEIVSAPRYVSVGETATILVEVNKPNLNLKLTSQNKNIKILEPHISADTTGLYALQFTALDVAHNVNIKLSDGEQTKSVSVNQFIIKKPDEVYLSSGDEVYIDKTQSIYNLFFKWYIKNRVGNAYHFRPSYQWSGVRITDENVLRPYIQLLNKAGMPFAWQVEGRTLASRRINLSKEALESPMFQGMQAHENDGAYYYWQHFLYEGLFSDLAAKARPYGGIFAKHRPIYESDGVYIHYSPNAVKDMKDGADSFVENLSYSRGESTRHTGPSTMFRYFYQAGYEWLGAEQMYGPENVIMSALRGASRAYGKTKYGSLHAVQWGSKPFTEQKHSLRFYLSLAVAYINGSSHINTEEGLWTDENDNSRYTKAGKEHLLVQNKMLDYIETHSRQGNLYTKIAVIQGRNDAWKSFGRTSIWSQNGEEWKFDKAMESFDLLKVFYPDNELNYCSTHGLFTSSPYGTVDILPIEADLEVMNNYKVLIFLGWNSFKNQDFIRINKFVENGGVLLLTRAHLNSELKPNLESKLPDNDLVIQKLLGLDYKTYQGRHVIKRGKGTIIYYANNVYPSQDEIKAEYIKDINNLAKEEVSKESIKGWINSSPYIDFTVWDSKEFRTLYVLNTDWESEANRFATLVFNNKEFKVEVPRCEITTIITHSSLAVLLNKNTSSVLTIDDKDGFYTITCQTTSSDNLTVFNGRTGEMENILIENAGVHHIDVIL